MKTLNHARPDDVVEKPTPSSNKCCEKCRSVSAEERSLWGNCTDRYCPCHKSEVCGVLNCRCANALHEKHHCPCPNPKPCKEHTPAARPGKLWTLIVNEVDREWAFERVQEFIAQAIASARKEELQGVLDNGGKVGPWEYIKARLKSLN